jgi:hypothetical protein
MVNGVFNALLTLAHASLLLAVWQQIHARVLAPRRVRGRLRGRTLF